jgi:hypothetical protein
MDQEKLSKSSKVNAELRKVKRQIEILEQFKEPVVLRIIVTVANNLINSKQVELKDTDLSGKIKDEVLAYFKKRETELTKEFEGI